MPGRPRKATHLKMIAGTLQKCRTNPNEPQPARGMPAPPAHLSDNAKTAWGGVAALLYSMGVLTVADGYALEGLCEAYGDGVAARAKLAGLGGTTYETKNNAGSVMRRPHPEVAMVTDADRRLLAWLSKFGLTPADRSRVSAAAQGKPNPFAELG